MWQLAAEARHPVVVFERVGGLGVKVVTNIFGSRARVARLLGADPARLHEERQRFDPAGHYHRPDVLTLEVKAPPEA